MKTLLIACAFLAAAAVNAQDWAKKRLDASPRHQEWVSLKNGDRTVKCFVVYPERKEKAPVVLLIHEIFGLSDWAMATADQFAEHGYIAIEPDFLSGMAPNGGRTIDFPDRSHITEAVSSLPPEQVMGDLNAAFDYVKTIPGANGKVAVAGFCWGGGKSFQYATVQPGLSAAFVFYGTPPPAAAMANIHCPVYGFYAGNDNRVSSTIPQAKTDMEAAHKSYKPVIYDGAGHGFMRAGEDPEDAPKMAEANKKAHDQAWKAVLAVLSKLPGGSSEKAMVVAIAKGKADCCEPKKERG